MSPITVGKHIFEMPSFFSMLDDVQQRRIPQACKGNQLVSEQPIFHFNYHWKEIRDTPKRCSKSTDSRHKWVFVGSQMPKFGGTSALPPAECQSFEALGLTNHETLGSLGGFDAPTKTQTATLLRGFPLSQETCSKLDIQKIYWGTQQG